MADCLEAGLATNCPALPHALAVSPGPGLPAPAPASAGTASCALMKALVPVAPLERLTPGALLLLAHTLAPPAASAAQARPWPVQQPGWVLGAQVAPLVRQALQPGRSGKAIDGLPALHSVCCNRHPHHGGDQAATAAAAHGAEQAGAAMLLTALPSDHATPFHALAVALHERPQSVYCGSEKVTSRCGREGSAVRAT